jgi:hypothetical protein
MVLALKASNEGIWDWWTGKKEIYYSRRILEFLECSSSSAPNLFLEPHPTVHPEDQERFSLALQNVLNPSGPELFAIDCRVKTGGDRWRWLRIRGSVVRDREGRAQRIAGSMIDITQAGGGADRGRAVPAADVDRPRAAAGLLQGQALALRAREPADGRVDGLEGAV